MYGRFQFYKDMFAKSGHPDAGKGFSKALTDDLIVSGDEQTVAARLREIVASGLGEPLAYPLFVGSDAQASLMRTFAAVAASES